MKRLLRIQDMFNKSCFFLQLLFIIAFALAPKFTLAAFNGTDEPPDGKVMASTSVSAIVESDVSASKSKITADPAEITADGKETSIVVVSVKDNGGNPLDNKKVVLSSNRGKIDTIEPEQTYSNIIGEASFTIKSEIAGKATISAFVDNTVTLDDTEVIVFKRPPAPMSIIITTTIPPMFGMPEKVITLFSPSQAKTGENELVKSGMELKVPFSMFLLGGTFATSQPILLSILIIQFIKRRNKEEELIEKLDEHTPKRPLE